VEREWDCVCLISHRIELLREYKGVVEKEQKLWYRRELEADCIISKDIQATQNAKATTRYKVINRRPSM